MKGEVVEGHEVLDFPDATSPAEGRKDQRQAEILLPMGAGLSGRASRLPA